MSILDWFNPLETSTSLDDVRAQWPALLEQHRLAPGHRDPRYQDALLSFIARSTLPANIQLGAVLTFVSSYDFDLRLALGRFDGHLDVFFTEWPASVADIAQLTAQRLAIPSTDEWLQAYLSGRITGLYDSLRTDGTTLRDWTIVFWSKFLEMSCRWADINGVRLAIKHGADIAYDDYAAITAVAEGLNGNFRSAYYTGGHGHSDYCRVMDVLLGAGTRLVDIAGVALRAAAAVDNDDMLEFLTSLGADIHTDDDAALVAAATYGGITALEWLLAHGADVHAANDAALIAAVGALDTVTVEALLDAGAELHVGDALALQTAFTSQASDLYSDESDLVGPSAEMVALLVTRGARIDHPAIAAGLRGGSRSRDVIARLLLRDDVDEKTKSILNSIAASL